MQEACYRDRVDELEDRLPVLDGKRALRCPNEACGHLECLSEDARRAIFEGAGLGRPRIVA